MFIIIVCKFTVRFRILEIVPYYVFNVFYNVSQNCPVLKVVN